MDERNVLLSITSMPQSRLIWIGWIVVIALALWLRLHDLELRPIHADEATGARILAERLESQSYRFDPKHFHGPLPSAITVLIANLRGENSWSELTVLTLRIGPVLAGILAVLSPLLWIRHYGQIPTLAAAALLASSPLLVYYNRMYIHESWLLLFGILALASLHRLTTQPNWLRASLTGLCIGLMFATKETFAISIIAWSVVGVCLLIAAQKHLTITFTKVIGLFLLVSCIAFVTGSFFYSDGFRNWQGIVDSVKTFFLYETTPGHDKPMGYYLHYLLWPKQVLGLWWTELFILLLAAVALLLGILQRSGIGPYVFLTLATLAHFLIYSLFDYKTPWLPLLPWAHACLLAGLVFAGRKRLRPSLQIGLTLLFLATFVFQTMQSFSSIDRYANDERNPYAYVPTSRDAQRIEHWLGEINALADTKPIDTIAVTGADYWPLPWYLRSFENVGYWPEPESDFSLHPIVFAMPEQVADCDALLQESHEKFPRTLRSNVPVMLYLRKDIWNLWIQSPTP